MQEPLPWRRRARGPRGGGPPSGGPPGGGTDPHVPYGTQVAYGQTDLSRFALEFREEFGIEGAQNVAVIVYLDADGQEQVLAMESGMPRSDDARAIADVVQGHSEPKLLECLRLAGIDPSQVIELYTEREPCDGTSDDCTRLLREAGIPAERVSWSFEHGPTEASKQRGNEGLVRTVDSLLQQRTQDGLPFPPRVA